MKILIKKSCKKCGNKVLVKRSKFGSTPAPDGCATCNTIGVEKAKKEFSKLR